MKALRWVVGIPTMIVGLYDLWVGQSLLEHLRSNEMAPVVWGQGDVLLAPMGLALIVMGALVIACAGRATRVSAVVTMTLGVAFLYLRICTTNHYPFRGDLIALGVAALLLSVIALVVQARREK